ncbi:MAG: hypothetical protein WCL71_12020 [Deltaproteobacteria bacterium]
MDKELFDQLHQSMKEAVAIAKDEMQPSRSFTVESPIPGTHISPSSFQNCLKILSEILTLGITSYKLIYNIQ